MSDAKHFEFGTFLDVMVWDITNKSRILQLAQPGDIVSLAFSQDGKWFASGSSGGSVILWKVDGAKFTPAGNPIQLNGEPLFLAFSPDNRWLAGGSSSGFAYLWETATGQEMTASPIATRLRACRFHRMVRCFSRFRGKL